jgi:hypothetical protein
MRIPGCQPQTATAHLQQPTPTLIEPLHEPQKTSPSTVPLLLRVYLAVAYASSCSTITAFSRHVTVFTTHNENI